MTGLVSVDGVIQNIFIHLKIIRSSCNSLRLKALRYNNILIFLNNHFVVTLLSVCSIYII